MKRLFRFTTRSRDDIRRDVDDEVAFHLHSRVEALEREGVARQQAIEQARREFGVPAGGWGSFETIGNDRERRRGLRRVLSELRQDAGYGLRVLRRAPGFSAIAILTLALGIGSNTAVFSIVNTLLLKPLPIQDPGRVVRIFAGESRMPYELFLEFRHRAAGFSGMAALTTEVLRLGEADEAVRAIGEAVSPDYFALLGVQAARGRTLLPTDAGPVVVLSDRAWRTRFQADPSIIGRGILLDRRRYEVVGIMPAEFRGMAPPGWVREFWIPDASMPGRAGGRGGRATYEILGRLAPGSDAPSVLPSLRVAATNIRRDRPTLPESFETVWTVPVSGLQAFRGIGALVPVFIFVAFLVLASGLVLLIGCANLAGLLLGRAAVRRHEIAVRIALGAGRARLIRQLLTESLLLAAAGAAAGLILSVWLTGSLQLAVQQLPFPLEFDLALDWRVAVYTILLSGLAVLLFGLAPARQATRAEIVGSLKDAAPGGRRQRARRILVVGQVAVCGVLLLWGLLFARSLRNVGSVDPGFDAAGVLLADISYEGPEPVTPEERDRRLVVIHERAAALPGVTSAGSAWSVPLALSSRESFTVIPEGAEEGRGREVMANRLTPGWFRTVRIPLLQGRDFAWSDGPGAPEVAIVNRTFADRVWQGQALGRRLRFSGRRSTRHDVEVVGVVADSKYWTLGEEIEPTVYLPIRQLPGGDAATLHVRTADTRDTSTRLTALLREVAPLAHVEFKTMTDATAVAVMPARVGALVTTALSAVAFVLAALGVYGLVSYAVAQRTREIGIRRAIGAGSWSIVQLVIGSTLRLVLVGLGVGLAGGVLGGRLLTGLIVGVAPTDPVTLGLTAACVTGAALLASLPAVLRALAVDPLKALRAE